VAACLTVLMGIVAFAIDGGVLQDDRQRAQATADAAALAAADQLYLYWRSYQGLDTNGAAAAAAQSVATENGFPSIQVNIPPTCLPPYDKSPYGSTTFLGLTGYVEVIVTYNQKRFFSSVFGGGDIPVTARAVARGRWAPLRIGILLLDPTSPGSLFDNGGGLMTVAGVPTIVDSNSPSAVTITAGTITTSELDITGVPGTSGNGTISGPVYNGVPPTPDPLAYLPEPDPSTMTTQSKNAYHLAGQQTATIFPGVYQGGIQVTGSASLTMMPGIYYMDGGGFAFSGLGNLYAAGVMIVNNPKSNSDNISINGGGSVTLTPITTGIYQGISLWQTRSSTNTVYVTGNGGQTLSGTFYAAGGTLNISGNGTNNVIGAQYISYDLKVSGGGSFSVVWDANNVSRARQIGLVE
jgi:hypothetical protein